MDAASHVTPPAIGRRLRGFLQGQHGRPISVGQLVDLFDDQSYGVLFALLALPTLIPVLPPGTAALIGLLFATLGLQRLIGLRRPWLPGPLRRIALGTRAAEFLEKRALPYLDRLERPARRRLGRLAATEPVSRAAALATTLLGLIMLSPLPFLNTLPALMVLIIGLGFVRSDGLYLLAGTAGGLLVSAVVIGLLTAGVLLLVI